MPRLQCFLRYCSVVVVVVIGGAVIDGGGDGDCGVGKVFHHLLAGSSVKHRLLAPIERIHRMRWLLILTKSLRP